MALVLIGKTHCMISNRIIQANDYFVCFPPFSSEPSNPIYKYSDGCAIREYLNNWKHKEQLQEAVKQFWLEYYSHSKVFIMLFQDDEYLIWQSSIEDKVKIYFLQHFFTLELPVSFLSKIYLQLHQNFDKIHFQTYANSLFLIQKQDNKMMLSIKTINFQQDYIVLQQDEWVRFCFVMEEIYRKHKL